MATLTATSAIDTSFTPTHDQSARRTVQWIRLRGDLTSADAVVEATGRLRKSLAGIRRLIVDAGEVDQADTKFVAVLVDLHRRARSRRIALEILPSPAVRKWLGICRLDALAA